MKKLSKSRMKQSSSCNASMFEMRDLWKMRFVLSNRVSQCMFDTSLVHVPFNFFFHLIADHVFQIGLAGWDETSLFQNHLFFGGDVWLPIAFKGTHVLVDVFFAPLFGGEFLSKHLERCV